MSSKWYMVAWVGWACFQGFVVPNLSADFSRFERAVLALLADAAVAGAFGVFAIIAAIKERGA